MLTDQHQPQYNYNEIQPYTKSLRKSIHFFAFYIVRLVQENRKQNLLRKLKRKRKQSRTNWKGALEKLNTARSDLVALADYRSTIVVPSFFCLIAGALLTSMIPHYYAQSLQLVATLDKGISTTKVIQTLTGLLISTTLASFFTGARGALFWMAGSRANYNVRCKLHHNLLLQEAAFFDANEVGTLISRLNSDVNKIGMVISYHVNVVCRQLAQFIFGSVYLWRTSAQLSCLATVGILVIAYISAIYGSFNRILAQRVQNTLARATAVAENSFVLSETIRAFDGIGAESQRYETAQAEALDLEETQAWGYGTHKFVSDTLQGFLQVGLLFSCWTLGCAGGLEAGKLTAFMFYANFVLESSNEVGDQWAKIQGAVGASTSVFDLIRRIPKVRDPFVEVTPKNGTDAVPLSLPKTNGHSKNEVHSASVIEGRALSMGHVPEIVNGHSQPHPVIRMKNMTLTYGTMDVPALDGIDLDINEGDRVAIVGRSGSGKSSMLRCMLRFYDPTYGSIELVGRDLRSLTREGIASEIAVVAQEPSLFPMSLLDNILYGIDKDLVDEETGEAYYSEEKRIRAERSLLLAGLPLHPGNDLNLELDTRVGDGGRSLSGGQRQRVAIARALIRQPDVLLLDEPTAALDSQSEALVVLALIRAMEQSKSMVMVTHRLGVVRSLDVNRVIVMEKGSIVETGHPEDLLRNPDGWYSKLASEQGIRPAGATTTAADR